MTPVDSSEHRITAAPPPESPTDFLLVAPLSEERDALLARLPGHRKLPPSEDDIRVYYAAQIPAQLADGRPVTYTAVVLPLAGMGHTQAAGATADAIRRFHPRYVLLIGIVGGMAKNAVALGDVLLSDQVVDYELAKVTPDGPSIRWQVHQVDQRLLIAAQNHTVGDLADTAATRPEPGRPRVHIGPVCTGNKVVADDVLADQLREVWVKLIGVEMEAGGVANAVAQSARRPGFFMIRGVSDLADADKDSNEVKSWRPYACEIAAAWTIDLLKNGPIPAGAPPPVADDHRQAISLAKDVAVRTPAGRPEAVVPHSTAIARWRERLDFLMEREAVVSSPGQQFELRHQIDECRAKLRELGFDP
ncbi:5'-methylthioadenosine/S-adenosylhomocysteine nucleosidase [Thiohalocapsa marina]|uniref:5'-methylthioadenosine/S-adenosylhomocysteine nucleosidase n=1 Tax=Thiohalocapsa marina TaxID=424902 RepID=A0A5M8FVP8_9GAMM|nr:5'-methylthioadenosine/S-adenosylhomocysteine nucleosidase [Thiohalocapsa marina]KAA6187908.1 5'-methylthioadenosine/S-adenosylhomocysteine nucleosidase [Thiohalocapsa marina]